jgi:Domain of unknown function (DUF4214)
MSESLGRTGSRVRLRLEALEDRCVPSATQYVEALYSDLLHRTGSSAEVAGFVQLIRQGVTAQQVASAFTSSPEFRTNVITGFYQNLLGRTPAASEVQFWLGQMAAGLPEDLVEARFLGSNEFLAKAGGTFQNWLGAVYRDVLGRGVDPTGQGVWTNALLGGATLPAIALSILRSSESDARIIGQDYRALLRRPPDATGQAFWAIQLTAGLTEAVFQAHVASSPEYIGLVAGGDLGG